MGWWHTTTRVNMRAAPYGAVRQVQPKNHNFWVVATKKVGAYTWLKSNRGNWYASAFCAKGRAQFARIPTPVPGARIGTPWRARIRGLWPTRGYHTGTDFPATWGTPVVAVRNGTVHRYRDDVLGLVGLLYADNGMTYWYCHLNSLTVGRVKSGQRIGTVGSSGTGARGPHLHLERRAGHSAWWGGPDLNPLTW